MKGTNIQYVFLISDPRGKRKFTLGGARYTLGRESDNTIQISSRFVSKHHAGLLRIPSSEAGRYVYRILDGDPKGGKPSVNGIIINHQLKVSSYDLQNGDIITLAPDVEIKYLVLDPNSLEQDEWDGFESLPEFRENPEPKSGSTQVPGPKEVEAKSG